MIKILLDQATFFFCITFLTDVKLRTFLLPSQLHTPEHSGLFGALKDNMDQDQEDQDHTEIIVSSDESS